MLYIERNKIIISKDYPNYDFLRRYLIKIYLDKHVNYFAYMMTANEITKYTIPEIEQQITSLNNGLRARPFDKCDCFYKAFYLYELDEEDNMIVPIGYLDFIKPYIIPEQMKINYKLETPMVNTNNLMEKINDKILPGITLRYQQVEGIKRAIKLKRTLLQLATGCFTGETRVPLTDGTVPRFDELIKDFTNKYVFTSTPDGYPDISKIKSVHITKYVNKILEIKLDDNSIIRCTENHPFMLRNGTYKEAKDLEKLDSLMPYNCIFDKKGKLKNKCIRSNYFCKEKGRYYGKRFRVHHLVYEKYIGERHKDKNHDIHHKDNNHYNDVPENLEELTKLEHFREHDIFLSENQRIKGLKGGEAFKRKWNKMSEEEHKRHTKGLIRWSKSEEGRESSKLAAKNMQNKIQYYKEKDPKGYKIINLKRSVGTIKYNCKRHHNNYPSNCPICKNKFISIQNEIKKLDPKYEVENHKIISIRVIHLEKEIPVYDLEVENKYHNFAIQTTFKDKDYEFIGSGVYVHNSGKTEIMCGITKLLSNELEEIPTTLVIEPTDKLKKEIIERFNKYGIDAVDYNKDRKIIEHKVNIAHPSSINIDMKKDEHLLDNVKMYFQDEAHHIASDSNSAVVMNVVNAEYIIGVSASVISQDHVGSKNLQEYTLDELKAIAMVGLVSYNITAKDLISEGKLAEPVLLVVNNPADEKLPKNKQNDWHVISKTHLQSLARIKYISQVATYFSKMKRKSLILVNNKEWAQNIAKCINDLGYGNECRLSFGGQIFLQYNNVEDTFERDKETFDKFRSGEVSILIGTQHLIEGVDVPSLDCVILPAVGKSERIQIQSCGRALRVTKNGNMAYIVDFSDEKDPVLNHQFKTRLSTYINTIGIDRNKIHVIDRNNINSALDIIFNKYEN